MRNLDGYNAWVCKCPMLRKTHTFLSDINSLVRFLRQYTKVPNFWWFLFWWLNCRYILPIYQKSQFCDEFKRVARINGTNKAVTQIHCEKFFIPKSKSLMSFSGLIVSLQKSQQQQNWEFECKWFQKPSALTKFVSKDFLLI